MFQAGPNGAAFFCLMPGKKSTLGLYYLFQSFQWHNIVQ
jgi:hypothetical protein